MSCSRVRPRSSTRLRTRYHEGRAVGCLPHWSMQATIPSLPSRPVGFMRTAGLPLHTAHHPLEVNAQLTLTPARRLALRLHVPARSLQTRKARSCLISALRRDLRQPGSTFPRMQVLPSYLFLSVDPTHTHSHSLPPTHPPTTSFPALTAFIRFSYPRQFEPQQTLPPSLHILTPTPR